MLGVSAFDRMHKRRKLLGPSGVYFMLAMGEMYVRLDSLATFKQGHPVSPTWVLSANIGPLLSRIGHIDGELQGRSAESVTAPCSLVQQELGGIATYLHECQTKNKRKMRFKALLK